MGARLAWALAPLLALGACRPAAGPARPDDAAPRRLDAAQLHAALGDPALGVLLDEAVALPLVSVGKVEVWLPGGRVVLEVSARPADQAGELPELGPALGVARAAAARALGEDPSRWVWRATAHGVTEVPLWASAQLGAGWVAALLGWPVIEARAAVLGAIGPDGALVAVPGQRDALSRAIAGAKLGVPRGAGPALAADVRRAGAEPHALADLRDALRFLTGRALPTRAPPSAAALAALDQERAPLDEAYARTREAIAARWEAILLLDNAPRVPAKVRGLADQAMRDAALAERLRQQGELPAALLAQGSAAARAQAVASARALIDHVQLGHLDRAADAGAALGAPALWAELGQAVTDLAARGPAAPLATADALAVLAEAAAHLQAWRAAEEAWRAELAALDGRQLSDLGSVDTAARLAEAALPVAERAAQVRALVALAGVLVELGDGGRALPGDVERLWTRPLATSADRWRSALGAALLDERSAAALELAIAPPAVGPAALAGVAGRWWRHALGRAAQAAAWRALAAAPASSESRTSPSAAELGARVAAARAQAAWGAVPATARFWLAAGRALVDAGEPAQAAAAYARSRATSELAVELAIARAARPVTSRAGGPAAPAR